MFRGRPSAAVQARTGVSYLRHAAGMLVYAVVDDSLSRHLLGDSIDGFVRRENVVRFIAEVRGDDPGLASHLRIEERELEAGRLN
jgi:hypothetical protein